MHTTKTPQRVLASIVSLGAGLVGGGAVGSAFRSDLRETRARLAAGSRVVPTASGPVEIAEAGNGPPVLVIHGAAGGYDMGLRVGKDVLGDGFHIVAPSRFGYLRTPMPSSASHDAQADALCSLLDALAIPRGMVIAVSAGAQSATRLALRHPERVQALVLITPALYLPPDPAKLKSAPPAFIFDTLLASDLLVWTLARLAPRLLVRAAGVPRALDSKVTPRIARRSSAGSSRHSRATRDWGMTSAPPHRPHPTFPSSSCACPSCSCPRRTTRTGPRTSSAIPRLVWRTPKCSYSTPADTSSSVRPAGSASPSRGSSSAPRAPTGGPNWRRHPSPRHQADTLPRPGHAGSEVATGLAPPCCWPTE